MDDETRLRERYAARRSAAGVIFPVVAVAIAVALGAWLVWVVSLKSTPAVTSQLTQWDAVDDHAVTAVVQVDLRDNAQKPACLVRASAEDHTTVGELSFIPTDGVNRISVRTERLATSLDSVGCTAKGQDDPR